MNTHAQVQENILRQLAWDPSVDASHIGVSTEGSVVMLTGYVPNYAQKITAEEIVKAVAGVRAVANDLDVILPGFDARSDSDIAQSALKALEWDVEVPDQALMVKVAVGRVTLEGSVSWQYQRVAAERAVSGLMGVRNVMNLITVKPAIAPAVIKNRIEAALHRHAEIEARNVSVEAFDRTVVLRGAVHTWRERQQVENAAWSAPGVESVENELVVSN